MTTLEDWISANIPDAVMEDAAAWMAILDAERCNEADRLAFARWLDEDPSHRWAFEELSEVWARLRTLSDAEPLLQQDKVLPFPPTVRSAPAAPGRDAEPPRRDWSTLAAVLLVAAGTAIHLLNLTPSERIETEVGQARVVELQDGSVLELNTRTLLEVALDHTRRRIQLVEGEAVFHVASDGRPFTVATEFGSVTALGTSFGVELHDGFAEVAVINGQVTVRNRDGSVALTEYDRIDTDIFDDAAVLGAGDWMQIGGAIHRGQAGGNDTTAARLSWRDGIISFDGKPLHAVIDELRRYTPISVHVADSALSSVRVSGEFETRNALKFLDQLSEKYGIVIDDSRPGWILLRTGPETSLK